jgi:hypothetical protein
MAGEAGVSDCLEHLLDEFVAERLDVGDGRKTFIDGETKCSG